MTREYLLSDLLTIKNGRDHKHLKDGLIPVYGSGGIMRYADAAIYDKPSILLPRKGSIDNIQYVSEPFWTVDTSYYTEVDLTKTDIYFLYSLISRLDLSGYRTGTGVPSMTFDSYYNVKVHLPDISVQRKVGRFLSSIDRLNQLSRKRIENLENLAKEIYDYWFVQFDFPDKNGKPYKSTGGTMVYNSQLKREIPDGWEVVRFGDLLSKAPATRRVPTNEYLRQGKLPIVDQERDCYIAGYLNDDSCALRLNDCVVFGDHSCCVKFVNFPFARGADGTQIVCSNTRRFSNYQFYFLLKEMHFKSAYCRHFSELKDRHVAVGSEELSVCYAKLAQLMFDSVRSENFMIRELTQLREFLLPLLMNGQAKMGGAPA